MQLFQQTQFGIARKEGTKKKEEQTEAGKEEIKNCLYAVAKNDLPMANARFLFSHADHIPNGIMKLLIE